MELIVDSFLFLLAAYIGIGVLFSPYFILKGAAKVDEGINDSPWHFRLIILPGVVLLWSVLLIKMVRK